MNKIILLLFFTGFITSCFGQTYDREWATYFGDSSLWISGIVEDNGALFIVGKTTNSAYIESLTSPSSFQPAYGGGETDGFMAKISEDGQLLWFTYYGGDGKDEITDIIKDGSAIYIVGKTASDGMATIGAYQNSVEGIADGFIVSFDLDGHRNWHTYFGGEGEDEVISLTTDEGKLFIHGRTTSHTRIATPGGFQETIHPNGVGGEYVNNFIAAFTNNGSKLWGTYYGLTTILNPSTFTSHQFLTGIAMNKTGIYVSGWVVQASDTSYYGTPGSFMETKPTPVPMSIYLSKFDEEGHRLWSTYYNALDARGNSTTTLVHGGAGNIKTYNVLTATEEGVYITARTIGAFAGTEGSFQPVKTGGFVTFIQNFSNTGERLWGSYLGNGYTTDTEGGFAGTHLNGLSKDSENNIYLAGSTHSIGDIATPDGFQLEKGNFTSSFVAKITPDGTSKIYATYYGGEKNDSDGKVIPIGNGDSFYLTGTTASTTGMTTPGAWQEDFVFGGEYEKNIFIVKFTDADLLKVPENENVKLILFPNPVNDHLYIKSGNNDKLEISIFNTLGQKVFQKTIADQSTPVDVGFLSKGVYLAEINYINGKSLQRIKLIKN